MTKITVVLQYRERGGLTPVETARGGHYKAAKTGAAAWAKRNGRYYEYEMSVEEFNALSPDLCTTQYPPGHEPIIQIKVEEVSASEKPTSDEKPALVATPHPEPIPVQIAAVVPNDPAPVQQADTKPAPSLAERIAEHIPAKNHRLNDLASVLGVEPAALRDFIESDGSGYRLEVGGWVKPAE